MEEPLAKPRVFGAECAECTGPSPADVAGFQRALGAITGKWKIEIVSLLVQGPMRFGALRRSLGGITQHMLTAQLRDLESNGIVIRRAYAEMPLRVEYELSQAGIELVPIFDSLLNWGRKHQLSPASLD